MKVLFPDTTVLINFAYCGLLDILEDVFPDRGWCLSVARECSRSATEPGLAPLSAGRRLFGDPFYPTRAELISANVLRNAMASPGDAPSAHMGEAETVAIISGRGFDAIFATDDRAAAHLANKYHIVAINTWHVLRLAVRKSCITIEDAWIAATHLRTLGRGWPPNCGPTRPDFEIWLAV